jgi:hypothetical protein
MDDIEAISNIALNNAALLIAIFAGSVIHSAFFQHKIRSFWYKTVNQKGAQYNI